MSYDAIVIGTGGVGSAALYHLARRGLRVLGVDRFPPGHDRGSSHGQSRVIRMAYFEHADYVPLLKRAYQLWDEVELATGQNLFHRIGLLEVGPPEGIVVPGVLQAARLHGLAIESLTAVEAMRRFPGLRVPEWAAAVFERDAGYLLVEAGVQAHAALAQQCGAELAIGESVQAWQASGDGVEVVTDRSRYSAARLVITAGPWAGELLSDLGIKLRVLRKHLHWYATQTKQYAADTHCPTYLYELPEGIFYGFPEIGGEGAVKAGEHGGGTLVDDPLRDAREVDETDRRRVEAFLRDYLPGVNCSESVRHTTCFYTMSPDEHFIIDRHPRWPAVAFAAGLSGHGYKFTPVLGEILADLVCEGKTALACGFLGLDRLV